MFRRRPAVLLMRLACRLYPRDFRTLLADDMADAFARELRRLRRRRGPARAGAWAVRTLLVTVVAAVWERFRELPVAREHRVSRASLAHRATRPSSSRSLSMHGTLTAVVQATRRLARAPGFTVAATLTLTLGIGTSAAIFALVDGILLRPLPYPDSGRLVSIQHAAPGLDLPRVGQSTGTYLVYRERAESFEQIGLYHEVAGNLATSITDGGEPERLSLALMSPGLLPTLGVRPLLGRGFTPADVEPDAPTVILLSHGLWSRRYGADPSLVGDEIEINGRARRIVGIMPSDFAFPSPETQVWFPLSAPPEEATFGGLYMEAVGRLRPGTSPEQATAELRGIIPSFAEAFDDVTRGTLESIGLDARVVPLKEAVLGDVSLSLWVLLATVLGVLLIACVNVANLFLVRAEHAQREVAIRSALGAGSGDVLRHWLAESALLALAGGSGGLLLARWVVGTVVASGAADLPRLHEVGADARMMAFAAVLTVVSGLLFGLAPTLRYGRPDVARTLRDGSRGATTGPRSQRARRLLVGGQIALAVVLLAGSALMVRSFWNLSRVDPGFRSQGVLTFRLTLPFWGYERYEPVAAFYGRLLEELRGLPGVEAAGAVSQLPLAGSGVFQDPLGTADDPPAEDEIPPVVNFVRMTPGYLDALGIGLRRGRTFRPDDADGEATAVLVSESLARRLFPGRSPLGRRIKRLGESETPWHTIVGVVGDVRDESLDAPPGEIVYIPVLERPAEPGYIPRGVTVAVRASVPPGSLAGAVRGVVSRLDADLPVAGVRPMSDIVSASMARSTFTMTVLLVAAAAALFLGAVGLYGVVSYAVSQRTREIGVRLALGARAADVNRMVLGEAAVTAVLGCLLGLAGTLTVSRVLRSLLFEVSPGDPLTLSGTIALLLAVAVTAAWLPARRAARVDPVEALGAD